MCESKPRTFKSENFRSKKEWIYFCLEFDLELCDGCCSRARKRRPEASETSWYCSSCKPSLHPDLLQAIRTRSNVSTSCDLCGKETDLRDCWISEDCERVYCSAHLEPVRAVDHDRIEPETVTASRTSARWTVRESSRRVSARINGASPPRHSIRAIYDGDRVIELDHEYRRSS